MGKSARATRRIDGARLRGQRAGARASSCTSASRAFILVERGADPPLGVAVASKGMASCSSSAGLARRRPGARRRARRVALASTASRSSAGRWPPEVLTEAEDGRVGLLGQGADRDPRPGR